MTNKRTILNSIRKIRKLTKEYTSDIVMIIPSPIHINTISMRIHTNEKGRLCFDFMVELLKSGKIPNVESYECNKKGCLYFIDIVSM